MSNTIPTVARLPELPPSRTGTFADKENKRSDVPCGSCTLCCRTLIVPLAQEEYERYDWAWVTTREGVQLGRALKRRPSGECVYLGEHGCTIHGRAPHVCQRFDCRELFLKSDRAGRRQMVKSGRLPKALFDKGREMLESPKQAAVGGEGSPPRRSGSPPPAKGGELAIYSTVIDAPRPPVNPGAPDDASSSG